MFMKKVSMRCSHHIHKHCLENSKKNQEFKCPTCQRPAQTIQESAAYYQKWISQYAMTEVPEERIGEFFNIECEACGKQFVKQWHPKGYICPHCDSIASKQLEEFKDKLEAEN